MAATGLDADSDSQLVHGLEDPWSLRPVAGKPRPATAARQQPTSLTGEWNEPRLRRRSKSLTLAEVESAFDDIDAAPLSTAAAAAPAEATSRSWIKPFSRKKKTDKGKAAEDGAASEASTSASGRATFTPAQLRRVASAGISGSGKRTAAAKAAVAANGAPAAATVVEPVANGGTSNGSISRRLGTQSYEHVPGRRPASAVPQAESSSILEVAGRSRSTTDASGSRWNPFARAAARSPAAAEPLLTTAGAADGSAATTAEEPSSNDASRRSSLDPANAGAVAEQRAAALPATSPFAQGAAAVAAQASHTAEESKLAEDSKKGHRRGRSLSAMLNPLKMKRRGSTATEDLDFGRTEGEERSGRSAADPVQRPKTPDPTKRASSGALGCFGVGPRLADDDAPAVVRQNGTASMDDERDPPLPPGLVGMKNLGNTCFINAAMQCLRHTPGLPLTLLPDLLDMPPVPDSTPPTPKSVLVGGADAATDASVDSAAASVSADSPRGTSPKGSDSYRGNGSPKNVSPGGSPRPGVLGVLSATDSPVTTITPGDTPLAATPEYAPLADDMQHVLGASPTDPAAALPHPHSDAAGTAGSGDTATTATPAGPGGPASLSADVPQDTLAPDKLQPDPSKEVPQATTAAGGEAARGGGADVAPPSAVPETEASPALAASVDGSVSDTEAVNGASVDADTPTAAQGASGQSNPAPQPQSEPPAAAAGVAPPPKLPPPPLERGELLEAFKRLVRELYGKRSGSVDPGYLVRRLGALGAALGEDFTDGGQHDCEEVLSAIIDRLHEDLNRVEPPPDPEPAPAPAEQAQRQPSDNSTGDEQPATPATTPSLTRPSHRLMMASGLGRDSSFGVRSGSLTLSAEEAATVGAQASGQPREPDDDPDEPQGAKAERMWRRHLQQDDSPVTDLFGGQLQGNITCHGCKGRFTRYEFFKGLSLPLVREARGALSSWFSSRPPPSSITDCLAAFTADESLSGNENEYYSCDKCKGKTAATINMRIHRFPRILMLHIKRFTYTGTTREKLTTNVAFPLKGLKLGAFASEESGASGDGSPEYDLYAVINHTGTMAGGHYVATCRVPGTKDQWHTFNDEIVVKTAPSAVATANAYILFYVRRDT